MSLDLQGKEALRGQIRGEEMKFLSEIKYVLERRALFGDAQKEESVNYALHSAGFPERGAERDQAGQLMRLAIDLYVKDLQARIDEDLMGWKNENRHKERWQRIQDLKDKY